MGKSFLILGGINAFLSVAFGAFGAHALKQKLSPDMLAVWETGVHYQMFHALGLILIGLLAGQLSSPALVGGAGWSLFAGICLFSGSLYVLGLSGIRMWGLVTPFGGIALLLGWALLVAAAWKSS
jgi:uncharacterized membrane protein YgdD (TMEM256/DUF423 family)